MSSPPLSAPGANGPNGVYKAGTGFPTSTFQGGNYWVDVVFALAPDNTPPTVTAQTPAPAATNVSANSTVTATFSEPVTDASVQYTVTDPGGASCGAVALSADKKTAIRGRSSAPLAGGTAYSVSVTATRSRGTTRTAPATWSFTTAIHADVPVLAIQRGDGPDGSGGQ